MALVEEAGTGKSATLPASLEGTTRVDPWVGAQTTGIPQREAPPQPWTPLTYLRLLLEPELLTRA